MFVITEADADAIRAVFNQEGELSAPIELRRRFPCLTDNAKARAHARSIAGWTPPPSPAAPGDPAASPQGQLARLLSRRRPSERVSGRRCPCPSSADSSV
jgi:hypothetical protein